MSEISIKKAEFLGLVERVDNWQRLDFPNLLAALKNDKAIARLLTTQEKTITARTIESWRLCKRSPNITNAAKLVVLSDGVLTPNKIFSGGISNAIKELGAAGGLA